MNFSAAGGGADVSRQRGSQSENIDIDSFRDSTTRRLGNTCILQMRTARVNARTFPLVGPIICQVGAGARDCAEQKPGPIPAAQLERPHNRRPWNVLLKLLPGRVPRIVLNLRYHLGLGLTCSFAIPDRRRCLPGRARTNHTILRHDDLFRMKCSEYAQQCVAATISDG